MNRKLHKLTIYVMILLLLASSFAGTFSHMSQGKATPDEDLSEYVTDDGWGYNYSDTVASTWNPVGNEDVRIEIDNGNWTNVELGFEYRFYGVDYDSIYINSNGWLSFTDIGGYQKDYEKDPTYDNLLAPYSTGLDISTGDIYYNMTNDQFIVTWDGVTDGTNQQTFQVILNETGEIWFNYQSITDPDAFVGIENHNSSAGISYDSTTLADGDSIRFEYIVPEYRVNTYPRNSAGIADEGQTIWLEKTIYNLGSKDDTYDLSIEEKFWNATIYDSTGDMELEKISITNGGDADVLIRLEAETSNSGSIGYLNAVSQNNTEVTHRSKFTAFHHQPILLVDSDSGDNMETYYMDALDAINITYNLWNYSSLGSPDEKIMSEHRAVIWFTGNKYGYWGDYVDPYNLPVLSGGDRSNLASYLDGGGRCYMANGYGLIESEWFKSGHAELWNSIYLGSFNDLGNMNYGGSLELVGEPDDPISDGFDINVYSGEFNDEELWMETNYILPSSKGVAFYNDTNGIPAVRTNSYDFRTVFTSFEFSGVDGAYNRSILMERILNWISPEIPKEPSVPNPSDGDNTGLAGDVELSVLIEHDLSVPMDVYFYNASDDMLIGEEENVYSGERASITWTGLEAESEYSWYVEVEDKLHNKNTSEIWSFNTNYIPEITSLKSPNHEETGMESTVNLSVEVYDRDGDDLNVTFFNTKGEVIGTDENVYSGENASIQWTGLSWGTTYEWYVEVDDNKNNRTSQTWSFKTNNPPRRPGYPSPELDEVGLSKNVTLSVEAFDKDGDSMTVTFYDASDDSEIGSVDNVDSGDFAQVEWSGLSYDTTYEWYAVTDDGLTDTKSVIWSFKTNREPYAPYDPDPEDGELDILTDVELSVEVFDPDGQSINVTFYDASTDEVIGSNDNVTSGETAHVMWSDLETKTEYNWYVVADDGYLSNTSKIWSFTTYDDNRDPNIPTDPNPPYGDKGVSLEPELSVRVTDPDGDTMDVSFYDETDDTLIGTDTDVNSGDVVTTTWSGLSEGTTYKWYVVITDGSLTTQSTLFEFETLLANYPPEEPTSPSPSNGSVEIESDVSLSVHVTDPDGDTMDVSFYDAYDDTLIGTDTDVESGSTASTTWSGLDLGTTYEWYAVVEDDEESIQADTWSFTTKQDIPDETPPAIEETTPSDGENDFDMDGEIILSFDEPLNSDSVIITLTVDGEEVEGDYSISNDRKTITFTPDKELEKETEYKVEVTAEDDAGNSVDHEFSFTTVAQEGEDEGLPMMMISLGILAIIVILVIAYLLFRGGNEEEETYEEFEVEEDEEYVYEEAEDVDELTEEETEFTEELEEPEDVEEEILDETE
ncbi:MAG: Ig-like domain-containing protein [Thermoplasmatota archaeon]